MGALLKERRMGAVVYSLFMFLLGLGMIVPFIFMLSAAMKPTAQVFADPLAIIPIPIFWGNFEQLLHHKFYYLWYWNSIRTVALVVIFRSLFVTAAAYAFAKLNFPGKNALFLILIASMMIPPDTTVVARFLMYKSFHLIDTQWVIVLPATFDVFFIFLLRQFFMGIPKELSESAIIDGYSHYGIYYRIILPLTKPALITMMLFTFIWNWNDFVNPFIFISSIKNQLVTVGLEYFQQQAGRDYALQMAGACFVILIPILLFAITQRYFIQGIVMTGIKG